MEGAEPGSSIMPRNQSLCIYETDRIAVTGASGWLGRELIHGLRLMFPQTPILALGSREGELRLDPTMAMPLHQWSSCDVAAWKPTLAVHLAYLTKDRLEAVGLDEYLSVNTHLSESAMGFYDIPSVRGIVVASSGAAIRHPFEPYGRLKAHDEAAFTGAGARHGIPTVIARAWSLSGRFCTKPERFLLYDLIAQALGPNSEISISASHEVFRKYVDASEYLSVCLAGVAAGWSGTVDSTGALVEAGQLADAIQATLGTRKVIRRPPAVGPPDKYFSAATVLDDWAAELGIQRTDLGQQIQRSSHALV
jgi:nucleoside-diphosphate-sugar epimerase